MCARRLPESPIRSQELYQRACRDGCAPDDTRPRNCLVAGFRRRPRSSVVDDLVYGRRAFSCDHQIFGEVPSSPALGSAARAPSPYGRPPPDPLANHIDFRLHYRFREVIPISLLLYLPPFDPAVLFISSTMSNTSNRPPWIFPQHFEDI